MQLDLEFALAAIVSAAGKLPGRASANQHRLRLEVTVQHPVAVAEVQGFRDELDDVEPFVKGEVRVGTQVLVERFGIVRAAGMVGKALLGRRI